MAIHNFEKIYLSARRRIEKGLFSKKNKDLILGFIDDLTLENISKPRLSKYMSLMSQIGEDRNA